MRPGAYACQSNREVGTAENPEETISITVTPVANNPPLEEESQSLALECAEVVRVPVAVPRGNDTFKELVENSAFRCVLCVMTLLLVAVAALNIIVWMFV